MTKTKRFVKRYTYGQALSTRRLVGTLIKLGIRHDIVDLEFIRIDVSSPGMPDLFSVKVTYK